MSANIFEKVTALGFIGASVFFIGVSFFKDNKGSKHDSFKVRQELLSRVDTKMLYSTMSFFYLQGFQQQSLESFFTLQKILDIEKPQIVALPISREDYESKYLKAMAHPKYREAMDKFMFFMNNKDEEGLKSITEFDLKNLEKLYLIEKCNKLKKCKIVCGRRKNEQYKNLEEIYQKIQSTEGATVSDAKVQDYTEAIMQEMSPKMSFSIFPESPYKTIIGVIEPELLKPTADKWKQKFKQNYSHQVIEDEEVIKREEVMREAQGKPIY